MSLYPSEVEAQHSSPDRITLRRLGEFVDRALTMFTPHIAYEPNTWEPNEVRLVDGMSLQKKAKKISDRQTISRLSSGLAAYLGLNGGLSRS